MSECTDSPRYVPVDPKGFRLAMGLRPLDLAEWLEGGDDARAQIARRRELIASRRAEVDAHLPGSAPACAELLDLVRAHLARHDPASLEGAPSDPEPLVAASLLVAEDLCVLERTVGGWTLTAATVCFPSRWRLADKIGTTLDAIHGPVPGYEEAIGAPTRAFFDRLSVEKPVWRLNWTLLDDPTLFQPAPGRPATAADPADLVFRVERQTLRRLPVTGAVVFTIRTYCTRAGVLAARAPTFAADVWASLVSAPEASLAYKGWTGLAARWSERFGLSPDRPRE